MRKPNPDSVNHIANLLRAGNASRRDVLRAAACLAAAAMVAPIASAQVPGLLRTRFVSDPFKIGVGSGYPRPDRVTLWTRLAPLPLDPAGGMQPENVDVHWELARDEGFGQIVASGRVRAVPELGHSVHAEASGLAPGTWYWYRFRAGEAVSPVGRTRTADAADADVRRLKLAVASCQHFAQGWFNAYRHMAEENLDLVLFVGDYIYEDSWGDDLVRRHAGDLLHALPQYRQRHAQYRSDPDLMRMHASVPWLVTWDDHEVDNDYAGDRSEHLDPGFLRRRAAGYQAYFEHMPLPPARRPTGDSMPLYSSHDFGRLARICMLDNRQYRSPQACADPYKRGGSTDVLPANCAELRDPTRTLLGREQEAWLQSRMVDSRQRWNIYGQQTLLAPFGTPRDDGSVSVWTDGWDGYPLAREQVLEGFARHRVSNPIILGGDLHASVVANVHRGDARSKIIASEFCGTSISAQGSPDRITAARAAQNPHVRFADASRRGYLTCEFTPNRMTAEIRTVDSVKRPTSVVETQRRFIVEDGNPAIQDA